MALKNTTDNTLSQNINSNGEKYGRYEIFPEEFIAGEPAAFTVKYHVGSFGMDDKGSLMICLRDASDAGDFQSLDPKRQNYISVRTDGNAKLKTNDCRRYLRPWLRAFVIDVYDGCLSPGQTITCKVGDTSLGSPSYNMQTFCQDTPFLKLLVDCFGTGRFQEIEGNSTKIVSGKPSKIVMIGPSQVKVAEPFSLTIRLQDRWGNLCMDCDEMVHLSAPPELEGMPKEVRIQGVGLIRLNNLSFNNEGVFKVKAINEKLSCETNQMLCLSAWPAYRAFWGDLHGQSEETQGTSPIEKYLWFAKEVSVLDFVGHQGNDFQITSDIWDNIKRSIKINYIPGSFVTFLGYEWSGNTPSGGDRNVYYLGDEGSVLHSSHACIQENDGDLDYIHVQEIFNKLKGKNALLVPHVGGRYANLSFHDEAMEPVIEICSAWGQFEWFLEEAMTKKYHVGFVGGSDDHTGRPGASYPGYKFPVRGALTCLFAKELTRESIWEAIFARRCYVTTGQRIFLEVTSDGHYMGEEYHTNSYPKLIANVYGTAPIEKVELKRGLETIHVWEGDVLHDTNSYKIVWGGAKSRGRGRKAQWDGSLKIKNGKFKKVVTYAFDAPVDAITSFAETEVTWISNTAGNEKGIILELDSSKETHLEFESNLARLSLAMSELSQPQYFDLGGVGLHVRTDLLRQQLGTRISVSYEDQNVIRGEFNAYYFRVLQSDGSKAWSSPIYVHFD